MKNLFKTIFILILLSGSAYAGSDGEIELSKKESTRESQTSKDCFEGLNRATFALNQGLDKIILKPIAQGYRKLPSPVRQGTSNVLDNLSAAKKFNWITVYISPEKKVHDFIDFWFPNINMALNFFVNKIHNKHNKCFKF